jgi:hypothetical protein
MEGRLPSCRSTPFDRRVRANRPLPVHGAHLDAIHGFAANAVVDDVGQLGVLPADCEVDSCGDRCARSLAENGRTEDLRPLAQSEHRAVGIQGPRSSRLLGCISHHNVFCFSPHSLHVYCTRACPGAAETRFGAPHFPHLVSMRVQPCLTVTVFRSNASFTKRSVSSRIACFDISRLLLSIPKALPAVVDVGNELFGLGDHFCHSPDCRKPLRRFCVSPWHLRP